MTPGCGEKPELQRLLASSDDRLRIPGSARLPTAAGRGNFHPMENHDRPGTVYEIGRKIHEFRQRGFKPEQLEVVIGVETEIVMILECGAYLTGTFEKKPPTIHGLPYIVSDTPRLATVRLKPQRGITETINL